MIHVKLWNLTRRDIVRPLFGKIRARDFIAVEKTKARFLAKEYPNLIGREIVIRPIVEKKPPSQVRVIKPKTVNIFYDKKPGRPKKKIKLREMIIVKEN